MLNENEYISALVTIVREYSHQIVLSLDGDIYRMTITRLDTCSNRDWQHVCQCASQLAKCSEIWIIAIGYVSLSISFWDSCGYFETLDALYS